MHRLTTTPAATPARVVAAPARVVAALVAVVAALALPAPAWAHGGGTPDGTSYRTRVTGLSGPLPGVSVRAVEAGARLDLVNNGDGPVQVLGHDGEPYLEIRPDGVFENLRSPAAYRDTGPTGGAVPAGVDPDAPPDWRRVSDEPRARWHDDRSHWMAADPPPQVSAEPDRTHRIRSWAVPLRTGTTTVEIRGTLDWVPPPNAWLWWSLCLLGAVAVAALGLAPARRRRASIALGALCVAAGASVIGYAAGREIDAGATGAVPVLAGLFLSRLWPVLAGLGAIAAGLFTIRASPSGGGGGGPDRGQPSGDFPLALAGVCLALFAGVADAGLFGQGVAPAPFSPTLARAAVALAIAIGAGAAVAGALRLRAAVPGHSPEPDDPPDPETATTDGAGSVSPASPGSGGQLAGG